MFDKCILSIDPFLTFMNSWKYFANVFCTEAYSWSDFVVVFQQKYLMLCWTKMSQQHCVNNAIINIFVSQGFKMKSITTFKRNKHNIFFTSTFIVQCFLHQTFSNILLFIYFSPVGEVDF